MPFLYAVFPPPPPTAPTQHMQVPNATVWYGPDTYMGRNLAQLLTSLAQGNDEEVAALHPGHTCASIRWCVCVPPRPC